MPKVLELNSPTETLKELVQSPSSEAAGSSKNESPGEINKMKKELGLLEGCAIILGIIFGSGIFISPKVRKIIDLRIFLQHD